MKNSSAEINEEEEEEEEDISYDIAFTIVVHTYGICVPEIPYPFFLYTKVKTGNQFFTIYYVIQKEHPFV